jgi:murein endopeptidase
LTQQNKNYIFDAKATKELILAFSKNPNIKKIFIEPHLKQRLGLQKEKKIRFHGCGAVRHDDHIHVQL